MPYDLTALTVTNAAGQVKTLDQARALLTSAVTRITVGSITEQERPGNLGETYYFDPETRTGLNSRGLPNQGWQKTRNWVAEFHGECRVAGKELCVSLAGFSPEEYAFLAQEFMPYVDVLEINAGCPNVWKGGQQKPIASYHPELLRNILAAVQPKIRGRKKTALKISPIPPELRKAIAEVINESDVQETLGINAEPNQSGKRPDGSEALAWRENESAEVKHTGGKSGTGIKELAIEVGTEMRERLDADIDYTTGGGIFTAIDAADQLQPGANGFFMGTAYFEFGPRVFEYVLLDL